MRHSIDVGFLLLSNSRNPIPSTRIAVLNMFPFLRNANFEPKIIYEPNENRPTETPDLFGFADQIQLSGIKIVIFQKIHGASVISLVNKLKIFGVRTIYLVCDIIDNQMAFATDATIVVTDYLRSLYAPELQYKIHVVHDGIEKADITCGAMSEKGDYPCPDETLKAIFVGSGVFYSLPVFYAPPKNWKIDMVGPYPTYDTIKERARRLSWVMLKRDTPYKRKSVKKQIVDVVSVFNPNIQYHKWSIESVYTLIRDANIGVIPIDVNADKGIDKIPVWKVKSENRLTLLMASGLPVIATPIPSYEKIIQHGVNGFFADTRKDWIECFNMLQDPELRYQIGIKARNSVVEAFSMEAQALKFIKIIKLVMAKMDSNVAKNLK